MLEIGIVGYGVVGQATQRMVGKDNNIHIFDPEIGHTGDITDCDVVFICINEKNTTMGNLNKLVDQIVTKNKKALIVIRTTVTPGTTDKMSIRHKREFAFMPEFLREWNAEKDSRSPDKIIIGTENGNTFNLIKQLFRYGIYTSDTVDKRIIQVKPIEAELAKLALNSLALIKVVFSEELCDLAKEYYADYGNIYKIFELDQNINERHLKVNEGGYRGADGKCLPKDSDFLIRSGQGKSRMSLLETAKILNDIFLEARK